MSMEAGSGSAAAQHERIVSVKESGKGPYAQLIAAGRHMLHADEPVSLGGQDTGPDPYELVLAGLGACTAMTLRMYADRKKLPLELVEVRLRHSRRASAAQGTKDELERTITLTGDLSHEQRLHLLEIAERCPVSRTLRQGAEIRSALGEGASPRPV